MIKTEKCDFETEKGNCHYVGFVGKKCIGHKDCVFFNTKKEEMPIRKMNDAEQLKVVKEICNDSKILADFLCKLAGYIYVTTNSTKTNIEFESIIEGNVLDGRFMFKVKELQGNKN